MTIDELLAHADRLEADLRHKQREIREGCFHVYTRTTLSRQIAALQDRVDEIRQTCAQLTELATAPVLAA